jgi:hypothetical protein
MCFFDQTFPMSCPYCSEVKPLYLFAHHLQQHRGATGLDEQLLNEGIQYTMTLLKRWTLASYEIRSACI